MNIIVGHTNMDLDCIGSIVLATCLYPDFQPVRSRLLHPVAKKLYNIYRHQLQFLNPKDLQGEVIEKMIIVDTRSYGRVKEYFEHFEGSPREIEIFDHHPADEESFAGALIHDSPCGANTSQLGAMLMEQGIKVSPEIATIALAGIYADTGNYTHENVREVDFRVSSWLLSCGADLGMIKRFLKPLSGSYQITLFHEVLNGLSYSTIHGHQVITCYNEIDSETEGLGAVVEKVFEVEGQDLFLAVFHFPKRKKSLIIGRNQKNSIDLGEVLSVFGGGGHPKAASAMIKHEDGSLVYQKLLEQLELLLAPAVMAGEIMSSPVHVVEEDASLMDASMFLEEKGHTGIPVVNREEELTGFITLRDIMKGRRAEQMHAPVKAYMSRNLITVSPGQTVREVEELLFENNIGHLPVLSEGRLKGIITRTDYLTFAKNDKQQKQQLLEEVGIAPAS
jgi:tRNA nucleotidyltransferase (CCA-adding enzyme)